MGNPICQNAHDRAVPGCLYAADGRYTVDFGDLGVLHWCAVCGPVAQAMREVVETALVERPSFAAELEAAIEKIERGDA